MTIYGSLFAGAGGFDLGFDAAGWECRWQVEIDPKAQDVLAHWWPKVDRRSDVTALEADTVDPVDVIVGGFPCQDLSVAGQRAGMERGTRSGLFYEFVRIVEEMRDGTDGASPKWVVWENVAGLLSLGNTLGSVYAAWDQAGAMVQEHRTVDTGRAFGVPQRRRRVLGVVGFDPRAESAGPILADPEGVRRDPPTSGEAGQDVAASVAGCLGGGFSGGDDLDRHGTHVVVCADGEQIPTPLMPTYIGTLTTTFDAKNYSNLQEVLEGSVLPFDTRQITSAENRSHPKAGDPSHPLAAGAHPPAIASDLGVRRLTPTECERLMGWPDGHTDPAGADSHRYRLCGNGVIAPAAEWIARRIDAAEGRMADE